MKTLWIALTIAAFIACASVLQEHAPQILIIIKGLGWLAPFLFLLLYCLATILLLPTMVLTLAGGALFGPVFGTLFNLIGATLGAVCSFCISRYLAIDWLSLQNKPNLHKLISGVERGGWQFAALLRLIPVIPFNLVNYGLGMTHIRFSLYVVTTFIFLAPAEIIYTYCGYASMDMLAHPPPIYKNASILALLGIGILVVLIKLFQRYHVQSKKKDNPGKGSTCSPD